MQDITMAPLEASMLCIPVVAASFIFFVLLYKVISPNVSLLSSSSYRNLSRADKVNWNGRVMSSIHAVLVSSLCSYVLLFDYPIHEDKIWGRSVFVMTNCAVVVGYMLADLYLTLMDNVLDRVFLFHHIATMFSYTFVMVFGVFNYFANFRLLAEMSTPLINNRWFLETLRYPRSSKVYIFNGIAMTVTFFIARILSMPFYYYETYGAYGTVSYLKIGWMCYSCIVLYPSIVLDIINFFWFYKLVRGCIKVIKNLVSMESDKPTPKVE